MFVKRTNTITLDFKCVRKKPTPLSIHRWIREKFKFKNEEIIAIQYDYVRAKIYVKLITEELMKETIKKYETEQLKYRDEENMEYIIALSEDEMETVVRIHEVPIEVNNEVIKAEMEKYGKVNGIIREKWNGHEDLFPVENGIRCVKMVIKKDIPSYISINGWKTLVTYRNQIRTCMICSEPNHERKDCPRKPNNRLKILRNDLNPQLEIKSGSSTYSEMTSGEYKQIEEKDKQENLINMDREEQYTKSNENQQNIDATETEDSSEGEALTNHEDIDGDISSTLNTPEITENTQELKEKSQVIKSERKRDRKRSRKGGKNNSSSEEEVKIRKLKIKLRGPDGLIIEEKIGEMIVENNGSSHVNTE